MPTLFMIAIVFVIVAAIVIPIVCICLSRRQRGWMTMETYPLHSVPRRTIWMFWDDLSTCPPIVSTNLTHIKSTYGEDWDIVVMTDQTARQHIPDSVVDNVQTRLKVPAHRADMYRLYVIEAYGGLWLDVSVLIQDKAFVDGMYDECMRDNKVGLFYTTPNPHSSPHQGRWDLENWFIMSPRPNHPLIHTWHDEMNKAVNMGFDTYQRMVGSRCTHNERIYRMFGTYLTMHACINVILTRHPEWFEMYISAHDSSKSMFAIDYDTDWNVNRYRSAFMDRASKLPCIKLISRTRDAVADCNAALHYTGYKK